VTSCHRMFSPLETACLHGCLRLPDRNDSLPQKRSQRHPLDLIPVLDHEFLTLTSGREEAQPDMEERDCGVGEVAGVEAATHKQAR
jgi:hypothetical protein